MAQGLTTLVVAYFLETASETSLGNFKCSSIISQNYFLSTHIVIIKLVATCDKYSRQ